MPLQCTCPECSVTEDRSDKCPLRQTQLHVKALRLYSENSVAREACHAYAGMLGRGGSRWPRLEHIREFLRLQGRTRAGIAACSMFQSEAVFVSSYFAETGISSLVTTCKLGGISPEELPDGRAVSTVSYACNPAAQALLLNEWDAEVNVLLGLCCPHDLVFTELSSAPVTTLFVKEHISGHWPYKTLKDLEKDRHGAQGM